jgi:hypothetical protein
MWPTAFALEELTAASKGKDRRAREESGELTTELATGPALAGTLSPGMSGRLARTHPSDQASTRSGAGPPIRKVGPE